MANHAGKFINVKFINNGGAGFAGFKAVREGTTLEEFLCEHLPSGMTAESCIIRVDNIPAASSDVLEEGQAVCVTPTKIEGGK